MIDVYAPSDLLPTGSDTASDPEEFAALAAAGAGEKK
jgi:hypothetical protein